jgi:hypothetical protein
MAAAEIDFECKSQLARADALIATGYKLYVLGRRRFVRHLFNIQYLFSDPLRATFFLANPQSDNSACIFYRSLVFLQMPETYFSTCPLFYRLKICKCIQQVSKHCLAIHNMLYIYSYMVNRNSSPNNLIFILCLFCHHLRILGL